MGGLHPEATSRRQHADGRSAHSDRAVGTQDNRRRDLIRTVLAAEVTTS